MLPQSRKQVNSGATRAEAKDKMAVRTSGKASTNRFLEALTQIYKSLSHKANLTDMQSDTTLKRIRLMLKLLRGEDFLS